MDTIELKVLTNFIRGSVSCVLIMFLILESLLPLNIDENHWNKIVLASILLLYVGTVKVEL